MNSYLEAQSLVDSTLAFDAERQTLQVMSTGSARSRLLARSRRDEEIVTKLVPYVGHGMLSSLRVNATTSEVLIIVEDCEATDNAARSSRYGLHSFTTDAAEAEYSGGFEEGLLLMLKICGALIQDYGADIVLSVATLVKRNTVTRSHTMPTSEESPGVASEVQRLLEEALNPESLKKRSLQINSNEPVLLVNNGCLSDVTFGCVVNEVTEQLHSLWNIWPVRIYAGRFLGQCQHSFSITLLNVVNTDIGGPSMIQLLDAPCTARGWLAYSRKEVWNSRDLLEKEVRQPTPLAKAIDLAEEVPISSSELPDDSSSQDVQAAAVTLPDDAASHRLLGEQSSSSATMKNVAQPEQSNQSSLSSYEDVRASFRADNAPIRHPSFEDSTQAGSLLDLIRSQSAGVTEPQLRAEAEEGKIDSPKSDEDFEVV